MKSLRDEELSAEFGSSELPPPDAVRAELPYEKVGYEAIGREPLLFPKSTTMVYQRLSGSRGPHMGSLGRQASESVVRASWTKTRTVGAQMTKTMTHSADT